MYYAYTPKGVCPIKIEFDIDGDIVKDIRFTGGCNGNLKAVSKLVKHLRQETHLLRRSARQGSPSGLQRHPYGVIIYC